MKITNRSVTRLPWIAALALALAGCAGQQTPSGDPPAKGETFASGQIKVSGYLVDLLYVVDNDTFRCTPVEAPRTLGAVLDAIGSEDQTYSVNATSLSMGARTVRYPIFADIRIANGERRVLIPATLTVKVDMQAGQVLSTKESPAFDVTATRSIKAGESLSVLFINGKHDTPSILSIETTNGAPSFTAFLRSDNPEGRRAALEAWRIESELAQR